MKTLVIIIICVILLIVVFYAYYGGFKKIQFQLATQGGETVVYEEITGDYRQSGVVMDEIYYSLLEKDQIETFKGFGKYYDNPKKVEKDKLQSEAGSIIENQDLDKLKSISGDFKIKELPKQEYIIAEFPYKGKMSVMFSLMKVYPALNKFAIAQGLNEDTPVMEIYDIPNKKILYRKEISN